MTSPLHKPGDICTLLWFRLRLWMLNTFKPRRCVMCGDNLTGQEWLHEVCDSCYAAEVNAGEDFDEDPHEDELLAEMIAQAEAEREEDFDAMMEMQSYQEEDFR